MTLSAQHINYAINEAVAKLAIQKSCRFPTRNGYLDVYARFKPKDNLISFEISLTTKRDSYIEMGQTVLSFIKNTDWKTALTVHAEWLKGFKLKTAVPKNVTDIIGTNSNDDDYDETEHSVGFCFEYSISDSALRTLERDYRKMLKESIKAPKYIKTFKLRTRAENEELLSFDVEKCALEVKNSDYAHGYKLENANLHHLQELTNQFDQRRSLILPNYEQSHMQTSHCRSFILQDKPCAFTINMHTAIEILVEREGRQFKMMVTPFKTKIDAYNNALDSIVTSPIDLSNEIYTRARATQISKVVKPCLVSGTQIISIKTASFKTNTNFASIATYRTIKVLAETAKNQTICFTIKRNGQVEFTELEDEPIVSNLKDFIITNVDKLRGELFTSDRSYVSNLIEDTFGYKKSIIIFA